MTAAGPRHRVRWAEAGQEREEWFDFRAPAVRLADELRLRGVPVERDEPGYSV